MLWNTLLSMSDDVDPAFDMAARIGTGWRWLDQKGSVVVREGRVVLRKRNADVIAEAAVADVSARINMGSLGAGTKVTCGEMTYVVEPVGYHDSRFPRPRVDPPTRVAGR